MHRESNLCMQNNKTDVILGACNSTEIRNEWNFTSTLNKHVPKAGEMVVEEGLRKGNLLSRLGNSLKYYHKEN